MSALPCRPSKSGRFPRFPSDLQTKKEGGCVRKIISGGEKSDVSLPRSVLGFCAWVSNEASKGVMNDRPVEAAVAEFLRDALADAALSVPKLEEMARAA